MMKRSSRYPPVVEDGRPVRVVERGRRRARSASQGNQAMAASVRWDARRSDVL